MKIQSKNILASILFVLISVTCAAQGPPGPPGTMPIDGFTTVTLVVGAIYGVRKVIKSSRD